MVPPWAVMSPMRAAGSPSINTVSAPGGRIGPPTWGIIPVTIGQICISETRAAGGIRGSSFLSLENEPELVGHRDPDPGTVMQWYKALRWHTAVVDRGAVAAVAIDQKDLVAVVAEFAVIPRHHPIRIGED